MSLVLIVDDNPHAHRMGRQILNQEGYDVATASNGDEAIEYLSENRPNLVMLDTRMPGPSGFEVCRLIKSDQSLEGVKVVLLAGPLEPFDPSEAENCGSDGVLHKPLDAYTLIDTVSTLIGGAEGSIDEPVDAPEPAVIQGSEEFVEDESPQPQSADADAAIDLAALNDLTADDQGADAEVSETPEPVAATAVAAEPDLGSEADPFGALIEEALGSDADAAKQEQAVREAVREVLSSSMPTLVDALTERVLARLRDD